MTLFDYSTRISPTAKLGNCPSPALATQGTRMRPQAQWACSALVAVGLVLGGQEALHAAERLTLGKGGAIDWLEGASSGADVETITPEHRTLIDPNVTEVGIAPSNLIEFASGDYPEAILPRQVREGTNVASQVFDFGGSITAPSVADIEGEEKRKILESLITEDPTGLALARKDNNALGTIVNIDLGTRIGVRSIRFFPRNTVFPNPTAPFQSDFLRKFRIRVNDGLNLTDAGNPIWEEFLVENDNVDPVTTIPLEPPRLLRFVRLEAISGISFELEKVQIFGEGFLPAARYVSPIIDMKAGTNWGQLRWDQVAIGNEEVARVEIRTRTGSDITPFVYTRKQVGRRDAEEIATSLANSLEPLTRNEYVKLPIRGVVGKDEFERGSVRDDVENWSPWSAPYDPVVGTGENGTEITSPGPRQYVQIRADFISEDLNSAVALENLSFTFTSPPLAREVVGEVFPREVAGATDVPFVFAVRTEMEAGLQGFDAIEVRSDQPIRSVQGIEILDGDQNRILEQSFTAEDAPTEEGDAAIQELEERRFVVRFPQVRESGTLVKVRFVGRMLSFSNTFKGRVLLIEEEAFQDVLSGNAAYLGDDDAPGRSSVTVLSPQLTKGRLVRNLEVDPVVSPNGDGIRDRASISFEVVTIVGQAGINAAVFDLSGRRVRQLLARPGTNGLYDPQRFDALAWDGRDASGQLVAPGVYVVRVDVQADARRTGAARAIGVAY